MANLTKTVQARLVEGLKRFQPVLQSAKSRDVNESDTIIADMLAEVFGYDKYTEITREHCIRNTYCDLAVMLDGTVQLLIEVKAIDTDLREAHVKQAVDYAANKGVEWVALTTGDRWQVYRVIFGKPIDKELVVDLNILKMSSRSQHDLDKLFLLSKESVQRSALVEYHDQQQATSKFFYGAVILSEPIVNRISRELRRVTPGLRIEDSEIIETLRSDILKREILEGDKAKEAERAVRKASDRKLRNVSSGDEDGGGDAQKDAPPQS